MKTVNVYYAQALFRFARRQGAQLEKITAHKQSRITLQNQNIMWGELHKQLGETLGVDFGRQLDPTDLGTFGHLLMSVSSLGEAISMLQRFYPLVGEGGTLSVKQTPLDVRILYTPHYIEERALRIEAVLSSIVTIARRLVSNSFAVTAVTFDYLPNETVLNRFIELADCTCITESNKNMITLPISAMSSPIHGGHTAVANSIEAILATELEALSKQSPLNKVSNLLAAQPYLNRQQVAERMHISESTLCRYLRQSKQTFKALKQQSMLSIANKQLKQGVAVTQIADQLHYHDASAFIKAYKQWTGHTPASFSLVQDEDQIEYSPNMR